MQITIKESNLEEIVVADLYSNFFVIQIIICDFIASLMVKNGVFHSVIAQWRHDDVIFDAFSTSDKDTDQYFAPCGLIANSMFNGE